MLGRIDINDFLIQPTESDYGRMQRRIIENERMLLREEQSGDDISEMNRSSVSNSSSSSNSRVIAMNAVAGSKINITTNNNNNNNTNTINNNIKLNPFTKRPSKPIT